MNHRLEQLLSIPKSFYVSGRLVGWKYAHKLPVCVRFNAMLKDLSGSILIEGPIQSKMLKVGFGDVGIYDKRYSRTILEIRGNLILQGKAEFGHGAKISIGPKGTMTIGKSVTNTAEGTIICFNKVFIEDECAISWDTLITDTDFHSVENTKTHQVSLAYGEIHICKGAWIGTRSVVLKNTFIPEGCILAANSTACKQYTEKNSLLAGNPAMVKKSNVRKSTIGDNNEP